MKKLLLVFVILLVASPAFAGDAYLDLLRSDVRIVKKEIIKEVMEFTDTEAQAFWKVYKKYQHEVEKVNDAKIELITDYAEHYWDLSDEKAQQLIKKAIDLEIKRAWIKKEYLRKFDYVIPSKKVAKFFQLESKLSALVQVQMAAELPMIE